MNARQWMQLTAVVATLAAVGSASANDTDSHRSLNESSASSGVSATSDLNVPADANRGSMDANRGSMDANRGSMDANRGSVNGNAVSERSTRNSEGVRASQDNTGRSALSRDTTTSGDSSQPGSDNGRSPSIV